MNRRKVFGVLAGLFGIGAVPTLAKTSEWSYNMTGPIKVYTTYPSFKIAPIAKPSAIDYEKIGRLAVEEDLAWLSFYRDKYMCSEEHDRWVNSKKMFLDSIYEARTLKGIKYE